MTVLIIGAAIVVAIVLVGRIEGRIRDEAEGADSKADRRERAAAYHRRVNEVLIGRFGPVSAKSAKDEAFMLALMANGGRRFDLEEFDRKWSR